MNDIHVYCYHWVIQPQEKRENQQINKSIVVKERVQLRYGLSAINGRFVHGNY